MFPGHEQEASTRGPTFSGTERRRARRRCAPLRAIIDGERYRILNWSNNGFAISDFRGESLALGEPLDLTIAIPLSGPKGRTRIQVRVSRYDANRKVLAFSFRSIDDRTFEILTRYAAD